MLKANVKLAASRKDEALPKGITNIGMGHVIIPDLDTQLSGFYVEKAGTLVAQFPQYKFIQKKGQKNDQHITI